MGDELRGHFSTFWNGSDNDRVEGKENLDLRISCPSHIMKFVQEKGYIAIDGISLTIGNVDETSFSLHLIPKHWHSQQLAVNR